MNNGVAAMDDATIILPSELTIAHAAECQALFLDILSQNQTIRIDDSQVIRIDTIGVQLLLSLINTLYEQKKQLHWTISAEIIRASFVQLGVPESLVADHL